MLGFVKLKRSPETVGLLKDSNAFALLTLIALRARRTDDFNSNNLEIGEALIGDHRACGLSQRAYRTAKQKLKKWNFATFQPTNRGTVAKLISKDVYDINEESSDKLSDKPKTSRPQKATSRTTTNKKDLKNFKKERNLKKTKNFLSDSDEMFLASALLKAIQKNHRAFKQPELQSWCLHINRMLKIDKRTVEGIEKVIEWCQSQEGKFWNSNILSTEKLRERYDTLFMKMNGGKQNGQNSGGIKPTEESRAKYARIQADGRFQS